MQPKWLEAMETICTTYNGTTATRDIDYLKLVLFAHTGTLMTCFWSMAASVVATDILAERELIGSLCQRTCCFMHDKDL